MKDTKFLRELDNLKFEYEAYPGLYSKLIYVWYDLDTKELINESDIIFSEDQLAVLELKLKKEYKKYLYEQENPSIIMARGAYNQHLYEYEY